MKILISSTLESPSSAYVNSGYLVFIAQKSRIFKDDGKRVVFPHLEPSTVNLCAVSTFSFLPVFFEDYNCTVSAGNMQVLIAFSYGCLMILEPLYYSEY